MSEMYNLLIASFNNFAQSLKPDNDGQAKNIYRAV